MIRFILYSAIIVSAIGCHHPNKPEAMQQPQSATANVDPVRAPDPVGAWLSGSAEGFTLFVFRSAGRGAMLAVGGGSAIGAPFQYTPEGGGLTITPPKGGSGPFKATFEGESLIIQTNGSRRFKRIADDDPTYGPYIAQLDENIAGR